MVNSKYKLILICMHIFPLDSALDPRKWFALSPCLTQLADACAYQCCSWLRLGRWEWYNEEMFGNGGLDSGCPQWLVDILHIGHLTSDLGILKLIHTCILTVQKGIQISGNVLSRLAWIARGRGHHPEALRWAEKALSVKDKDPNALALIGERSRKAISYHILG